jgi:hypothetical protein
MKMATDIPAEITTPDTVETRIGTPERRVSSVECTRMVDGTHNNESEGPGCAVLAVAMLLLLCPAALADTDGNDLRRGMGEKFFVSIGVFNVKFDTTASKNFPGGAPNPTFDLEDILGLDDKNFEGRLSGYWRIAPKHRLTFGYMLLGRNSIQTILDDEFEWDDTTWPVGAELSSMFDTEVLELGYNYSFSRKPKQEWGLAVGLSMFKFSYSLAGAGSIELPDGSQMSGFFVEEDEFWTPVPSLGVQLAYSIAPRWVMRSSAKLLAYSTDSLKIRHIDARAEFEFYPWKHVGFGLGFSLIEFLYVDKGDDELRVDYGFDGWTGYVGIVF